MSALRALRRNGNDERLERMRERERVAEEIIILKNCTIKKHLKIQK